jgi:hypothetical protein
LAEEKCTAFLGTYSFGAHLLVSIESSKARRRKDGVDEAMDRVWSLGEGIA